MQPIRILTPSFKFLGEIDDYESLQFIRRFRKPGEFELHINANKNLTDTLQEDNLIVLSPRKVGVILHRELNRENTEQLMIKGYTLQGILSRRIIVPPVGQAYDKIKANAETALKHYVRQNAVEPVDPNRIIPNLIIADDMQRGQIVDWQSRFKNLVDELESISFSAGIGWDIFLDLQQQKWVFEVYVPRNLTASQSELPPVIFSIDFDNIKNQTFTDSAINYKNYGYIGGQGEGEDRAVVEVGDASGISRIETFIDARDIEDGENLTVRGQQKLQEMQKILSFESEILTYGPFVYEKDWDLGDIVTVQDKKWGITLDTPITEVKEIYEPGGFRLEATFGNTMPTLIERIKKTIDAPMVEKPIKTNVPTKLSELENDAGYITADDIPAAQSFIHEQLTPSSLWVITHNLNRYPTVTVTDSSGNVVVGDIKHTSLNTTEISFSAAFAGKAILV